MASAFLSSKAFWPYVSGVVLLLIGLSVAFTKKGFGGSWIEKALTVGPALVAAPIGVFGTDHFVATAGIATMVPSWLPAPTFWVYLVGAALIAAAVSIAANKYVELSATLLGLMLSTFVGLIHIPNFAANPTSRFAFALVLRDLAFSAGAIALSRAHRADSEAGGSPRLVAISRVVLGAVAAVFGAEHFLFPHFAPVVPLAQPLPSWMPLQPVVAYVTGVVLVVSGVSLVANRMARLAAAVLGIAVLGVVIVVYVPLLVARPLDLQQVNFLFDTLLFGGSALALGGALAANGRALGGAAAEPAS
jgi:uncharacterized membrane protein